jgi:hypothetical protein
MKGEPTDGGKKRPSVRWPFLSKALNLINAEMDLVVPRLIVPSILQEDS